MVSKAIGNYQIIKRLSPTASGQTFLAIATDLSVPIPCVIQKSGLKNAQEFRLFCDTFNHLGQSSQLPTFIDSFQEEENFYLVEESIAGKNLATLVAEEGLLSSDRVIKLLSDSLPILQVIHQERLIHGDLKPTNLIYSNQQLKLVDFGAAHLAGQATLMLGDPEYAAPEQLQGQATYASDLYSLGTICLHLLTGIPPFDLLSGQLPDLPHLSLQAILERLVEPDVNKRFHSAKDVLQTMQRMGLISKCSIPQRQAPIYHCYATLRGHGGLFATVNAVAINPNGRIVASGSDDGTICLWGFPTGDEIGCLEGNAGLVKAIAFSPDGFHLASGNQNGTIELWDWDKQELAQTVIGHEQAVNAVLFSPQGQLLSGSTDKTIKLWNLQTGEAIATLARHHLGISAIAHHPTLPLIATASLDRTVKLWDLKTLKLIRTLNHHTWAIRAISFSPDGKFLATGGDDNLIFLWDVTTRQVVRTISGHAWTVTGLAFTLDRQTLLSSSWDKTIKLWQVSTGKLMAVLEGHTDSISAIAIHPSVRAIVSASKDETVRFWRYSQF